MEQCTEQTLSDVTVFGHDRVEHAVVHERVVDLSGSVFEGCICLFFIEILSESVVLNYWQENASEHRFK